MVVLQILEYDRYKIREWESLKDCAIHHGVSTETIKRLIYYGGCLDGHTTFDIPLWCTADIKKEDDKLIIYSNFKKPKIISSKRNTGGVKQGRLCLPQGVAI